MNNNNFNSSTDKTANPNDQQSMINLFKKNTHLTALYKKSVLSWLD